MASFAVFSMEGSVNGTEMARASNNQSANSSLAFSVRKPQSARPMDVKFGRALLGAAVNLWPNSCDESL